MCNGSDWIIRNRERPGESCGLLRGNLLGKRWRADGQELAGVVWTLKKSYCKRALLKLSTTVDEK